MMLLRTFTTACVIVLIGLTQAATQASAQSQARTLRVAATGRIAATPDMVIVTTGVVTQAKTARQALSDNNRAAAAMIAALKAAAIADRDIQTAGLNVQPLYSKAKRQNNGEQLRRIVGYSVTNQVRVRIRDLAKGGEILDTIVGRGANRMNGLQFAVSNADELRIKAEALAVREARTRAQVMAEAAGVALGQIVNITTGSAPQPVTRHYARTVMAESVPIQAGEKEISASVTVTWEIVDLK